MPFAGHVAPMRAIAAELVRRGHDVRAYTGTRYAEAFTSVGAEHLPWREAPDFDENDLEATFPDLGNRHGMRQLVANIQQIFIGTAAAQLRDLERAWDDRPWDILVAESTSVGAMLAAERLPAPWVTIGITPLTIPASDRPPSGLRLTPGTGTLGHVRDAALRSALALGVRVAQRAYDAERAHAGLPAAATRFDAASYSTRLTLASGVPALDFAPLTRPDWVEFVGRIAPVPSAERPLPAWWPELERSGRPVILVTQGTFNTDPTDLIRPALQALDGEDAIVVATTGNVGVVFDFPLPPNARVSQFIPFERLLPLTSVMITNGGWGGTLAGLAAGVPLIVAGGDLDKPEVAARVAYSGAGVDLRTGRPSRAAIARAYGRVVTEPGFRAAAGRIAAELARHDGAREVADRLEAVVAASG
jgi:MGT family glycosyltransferase